MGKVQPERRDDAVEILEICAQTMMGQQQAVHPQQNRDCRSRDATPSQQQPFDPDDFPRFGS